MTTSKCHFIFIILIVFIGLSLAPMTSCDTSNSHKNTTTYNGNVIGWFRRHNTFKCFVCFWSLNEEPCGDDDFSVGHSSPGKFMINCLACYKQVFYQTNGLKTKVLRGCAQELPHYALNCQRIFNEDGSYLETCACASAYCNSAFVYHPYQIFTLAIPLLFLLFH